MSPDMRQVTPKLRYKFTEAASLYMTSDTKLKPYRLGREHNISNNMYCWMHGFGFVALRIQLLSLFLLGLWLFAFLVGDCEICALLVEYHMQRFGYIGS
jgi:hypothetical protein